MRSTGFSALSRRRRLRLFVTVLVLAVLGLLIYLSLTRGAELFRQRVDNSENIVSVGELWESGRYSEVVEITERRLQEDPMDRDALLFAGYSRYFLAISRLSTEERNSDLDQSIKHLRLLLARGGTPNPERVEYVIGKAYLTKGRYWSDLAVKYLSSALDSGYEPEDIHEYLGRSYSAMGEPDLALEWYEKAAEKYPTDRLLITLGEEAFKLARYNAAASYYHRAIEVSQDDSLKKRGLSQLGQLYYDVGNYEMARGVLESLVSMESGNEAYLFLLAETYHELGLDDDARRLWFAVTRIDPRHVGALRRLYD